MLNFNFSRVFKARGIDRPFSYLVKLGYSDNFATRITHSRIDKLNLREIEKLCNLLQCTPNDFIEWTPNNNDENNENHPLYSIRRTDKEIHLTQILNSIPLNKLDDIEKIINETIKK